MNEWLAINTLIVKGVLITRCSGVVLRALHAPLYMKTKNASVDSKGLKLRFLRRPRSAVHWASFNAVRGPVERQR